MPGHWECKFCDNPNFVDVEDERVCGRCGAEWEGCKIWIEHDEKYIENFNREWNELEKELERYEALDDDINDEDYYFDDDRLPCGCCACCGCSCEEYEIED